MAFNSTKADSHARTGQFNAIAATNSTLTDYGDCYTNRIKNNTTINHERDLLAKIVQELEARHNGNSTSRYNGRLTNWELNRLNTYKNALGMSTQTSWYECFFSSQIDLATARRLKAEAETLYSQCAMSQKAPVADLEADVDWVIEVHERSKPALPNKDVGRLLFETFVLNFCASVECILSELAFWHNPMKFLNSFQIILNIGRIEVNGVVDTGTSVGASTISIVSTNHISLITKTHFDELMLGGIDKMLVEPHLLSGCESFKSTFQMWAANFGRV